MSENFKKIRVIAAATVVACFTAYVAHAQTPAQDSARITADQAAIDAAKAAIKDDTAQMTSGQASLTEGGVDMMSKLNADKQAESTAEAQLNSDMQLKATDDARFNGPPPAAATAPAAGTTGTAATPSTAPRPDVPAGVPPTPTPGVPYTTAP